MRLPRFIGLLVVLLGVSVLAGCGFHLRGTGQTTVSIDRVHVNASNAYGELQQALIRRLDQSGATVVARSEAEYIVSIGAEEISRRPVSTTNQISVAEYEMSMVVDFTMTAADGDVVVPSGRASALRIYAFDRESLVGASEEEALLVSEMRRDVVDAMMSQIDAGVRSR